MGSDELAFDTWCEEVQYPESGIEMERVRTERPGIIELYPDSRSRVIDRGLNKDSDKVRRRTHPKDD
jgi:hypothetical protein